MTDTVRAEFTQLDGDKKISYVMVEWYDMDRTGANFMSMDLVSGLVEKVESWRKLGAAGINAAEAAVVEDPQPKGAIR
jgi:hypothetical protein